MRCGTRRGALPDGHSLRERFPERWVRFHSLPSGKRYATTTAEAVEVRRRHLDVLAELRTSGSPLVVIAQDYAPGDGFARWVARALPAAELWRAVPSTDREPESTYWIGTHFDLETLLEAVAGGDTGSVIIADETLEWLYHPYDGGADVITATTAERDDLATRHVEWRSSRTDGL